MRHITTLVGVVLKLAGVDKMSTAAKAALALEAARALGLQALGRAACRIHFGGLRLHLFAQARYRTIVARTKMVLE